MNIMSHTNAQISKLMCWLSSPHSFFLTAPHCSGIVTRPLSLFFIFLSHVSWIAQWLPRLSLKWSLVEPRSWQRHSSQPTNKLYEVSHPSPASACRNRSLSHVLSIHSATFRRKGWWSSWSCHNCCSNQVQDSPWWGPENSEHWEGRADEEGAWRGEKISNWLLFV